MLLENKIAIFGGSFNPPHIGHEFICMWLIRALNVKEVRMVPVYEHIFGKHMESFEHRIMMCYMSAAGVGQGRVSVDICEQKLPTPNTSYDLLNYYKNKTENIYSDKLIDPVLVIGADVLLDMKKWYRWNKLPELATILVIERGDRFQEAPFETIRYDIKLPSTSSSEIRERIKLGKSIDGFVSHSVKSYINRYGLYK